MNDEEEKMKNKICLVLLAMMLCSAHVLASAEAIATPSDLADSAATTAPAEPPASKHTKRKPTRYEIPAEVLEADANFAALMAEAEKYIRGIYFLSGAEAAQNGGNRKICTRYVFLQRRRGGTQSQ